MLSTRRDSSRARERGTVAIVVAMSMTALLVVVGLVLDFGLVRIDRQVNKAAADAATSAGLLGLDGGEKNHADPRPFAGVCQALDYLRLSHPDLATLPGTGNRSGNNVTCPASASQKTRVCSPADQAVYAATLGRFEITIKSPYHVNDGGFMEESLASLQSDPGDGSWAGCDQLAVMITQSRSPGLGSLATSSDLVTHIRSVGRVTVGSGELAPALLLLERTTCNVLSVGSAGSASRIYVEAAGALMGTIHADSDATGAGCGTGSGQQVFLGKQTDGIVAFGNGTDPGLITSVAAQNAVPTSVLRDADANVYGVSSAHPATTGTRAQVRGRKAVTRRIVDRRYLSGVTAKAIAARGQWSLNPLTPAGYARYGCPTSAVMSILGALTSADSVYIDCPGNSGITLNGTIGAGRIYFHGFIKGGKLAMPNATEVYIDNTSDAGAQVNADAVTITNSNDSFCVRSTFANCEAANASAGKCSPVATGSPTSKATFMVRRGGFTTSGGLLRLCNTSVIMGSGDVGTGTAANPGACLPTTWGAAPTSTPCPGPAAGTSYISLSGLTDWTAPNAHDNMVALGLAPSQQQALWDQGEDLALWTETHGAGPTFKMTGGGALWVRGVFMVPHAHPFTISGNGGLDLTNAQFITRSFAADGGAQLRLRVDPFNSVTLPKFDTFLVR